MEVDGEETYWGQILQGDLEKDIKAPLGERFVLKEGGANAEEQVIKDKDNDLL